MAVVSLFPPTLLYPRHTMTQVLAPPNALGTALDASDVTAQSRAERYEIAAFRTEKFDNHDEDSSCVDSFSDSPAIRGIMQIFHDSK